MLFVATIGSWCQLNCPDVASMTGAAAASCHEMRNDGPALINAHDCGDHAGQAFAIKPATRIAHIAMAILIDPPASEPRLSCASRIAMAFVDTGPPRVTRTITVLRI